MPAVLLKLVGAGRSLRRALLDEVRSTLVVHGEHAVHKADDRRTLRGAVRVIVAEADLQDARRLRVVVVLDVNVIGVALGRHIDRVGDRADVTAAPSRLIGIIEGFAYVDRSRVDVHRRIVHRATARHGITACRRCKCHTAKRKHEHEHESKQAKCVFRIHGKISFPFGRIHYYVYRAPFTKKV